MRKQARRKQHAQTQLRVFFCSVSSGHNEVMALGCSSNETKEVEKTDDGREE